MRDIRKWGLEGSLILRSDQEAALTDLIAEIIAHKRAEGRPIEIEARDIREESPVSESQCSGVIESGVRSLEGMVRTVKFA